MYKDDLVNQKIQSFIPIKYQADLNVIDEYFLDIESFSLHIDHYKNEHSKGTFFLFHGVGGNGRLLSCFAYMLYRLGYEVIVPDLPLYGFSQSPRKVLYDDWVNLGVKLVNHYQIEKPIYLFGASAGGLLTYQIASLLERVDGLFATCILNQNDRFITKKTSRFGALMPFLIPFLYIFNPLIGHVKIPLKWIVPMHRIANNKDFVKVLLKDKRSSGVRVSISFIKSMINPKLVYLPHEFDKCPIYVLHPTLDLWTDVSLTRRFFDQLKVEKKLIMIPYAGHFPIENEALDFVNEMLIGLLK